MPPVSDDRTGHLDMEYDLRLQAAALTQPHDSRPSHSIPDRTGRLDTEYDRRLDAAALTQSQAWRREMTSIKEDSEECKVGWTWPRRFF